jgi:hypothetical protein
MIRDIIVHHPFLKNITLSFLSRNDICNAMTESITKKRFEVFKFLLLAIDLKSMKITDSQRKKLETKIVFTAVCTSDTSFVAYVLQQGLRLYHLPDLNLGYYSVFTPAIERNDLAMIQFLDGLMFEFTESDVFRALMGNIFSTVEFICRERLISDVSVLHNMIRNQNKWKRGCNKVFRMYVNMFINHGYPVDKTTATLLLRESNTDILKENLGLFDDINIADIDVPYSILKKILMEKDYEFFKWVVTRTRCAVVKFTTNNFLILQECFRIPGVCPYFIKWILTKSVRINMSRSFNSKAYISDSISLGNLEVLEVLCSFMEMRKISFESDILYESIANDKFEVMKWCVDRSLGDCRDLRKCWLFCVRNKKLNVIKWLYRKKLYVKDQIIFDLSIKYYNARIFSFLRKKRFPVSSIGLNFAVLTRNITAIKKLCVMGCPYNYSTIKIASDNEDYDMVEYFFNCDFETDPTVYRKPIMTNNLDMVTKYLYHYQFPIDSGTFKLAVKAGAREIARLLLDNHCDYYDEDIFLYNNEYFFEELDGEDVSDLLELVGGSNGEYLFGDY